MVNHTILLVLGCLVVAGLAVTTGCDKGGGQGPPPMDAQAIIGTWLEVREGPRVSTPRFQAPEWESPNIRQITFNADNTFKLIVCKPSGTPLDASKAIEGTWKVEENSVRFTVTSNTLEGKYQDWVPLGLTGPFEDGNKTRCTITHENFEEGIYEHQG
jgi:hypothetical protein